MFSLISSAFKAVKNLFNQTRTSPSKPTPKPKPKPKPTQFAKLAPAPSTNTIARYWNNGNMTPQQRQSNARASANLLAYQKRVAAIAAQNRRTAAARALQAARLKAAMAAQQAKFKSMRGKISKYQAQRNAAFKTESNKAWYGKANPDAYDKRKLEARDQAQKFSKNVENNRSFLDNLTGGFTSETRARKWAQSQQQNLQKSVFSYELRVKAHNKELAKRNQQLKSLAVKGNQKEYTKAYNEAQKWLKTSIGDMRYQQASIEGSNEGYEKFSNSKLNSPLAKFGQFFDPKKNPVTGGMRAVWDHTLGGGSKYVPSLVTAPSRAVTAMQNAGKKKGDKIYLSNGKTVKYDGNAWTTTYGQRNLNIGNADQSYNVNTAIDSSYQNALRIYKQKNAPNKHVTWYKDKVPTKEQWLNEKMDNGKTRKQTWFEGKGGASGKALADISSNTLEFGTDPLLYAGAGTMKLGSAIMKKLSGSKWLANLKGSNAVKAAGETKVVKTTKKLGAEKKTRKEKYNETVEKYSKYQAKVQDAYLARFKKLNDKITKNQYNYSVLDDLAKLTDDEAGILQRMTGIDKFALRDRISLARNSQAARKKLLLDVHKRAQGNAALMKELDRVGSTRFTGKYYSKSWLNTPKDKNKYSFRAFRKNDHTLDAENLRRAQVERYIQSSVDDVASPSVAKVTSAQKELKSLKGQYEKAKLKGRPEMEAAYKKTRTVGDYYKGRVARWKESQKYKKFVQNMAANPKKTAIPMAKVTGKEKLSQAAPEKLSKDMWINSGAKAAGLPMAVWKASVLALRPAWYVNNQAWNTFAGFAAGGARFGPEAIAMLKKGGLAAARKENPKVISKFEKYFESKGNPLWKGASAQEDWGRLAAYKAAKAKGLTDAEALKRVERYFFNYGTKNIERPLKAVMPFWAWTKGTAKAAAVMPFDRPLAAKVFHKNDENNKNEINKLPKDMRKYYEGKQYIGKDKKGNPRFMNTPFNPMSGGNFAQVSANPFLAALSELSTQKDYYGNELKDKTIKGVFADKFAQPKLANKAFEAWKQANGDVDKAVKYFGEVGSDGYAMTKERQGTDPNKKNYSSKLDAGKGLQQDWLAFFGVPKTSSFDKVKYAKEEKLTKLNTKFFDVDWEKKFPDYNKRVAAQEKLAKDYGFDLQKDLYNGLWSKNDSELTTKLKKQKQEARDFLSNFYKEYGKQAYGTKSIWVRDKMGEIVKSGVIGENPFIGDGLPKWFDPNARQKADKAEFWRTYFNSSSDTRRKLIKDNPKYNTFNYSYKPSQKKVDYLAAKQSGDWSKFTATYGFKSEKQRLYMEAKQSGDWSKFYAASGDTAGYKANYAKNAARIEAAKFWKNFFASDQKTQDQLLKDNPKYDKFKDEEPKTQAEWDAIMLKVKADRKKRAFGNSKYKAFYDKRFSEGKASAVIADRRASRQSKRIVWK